MSLKTAIEFVAAVLSVLVSLVVLAGVFTAHKKGFFKAVHRLALHHHALIEKEKREKEEEA